MGKTRQQAGTICTHEILQDLVPLNALSSKRYMEIASELRIEDIGAGRYLFGEGEWDNRSLYLLDGEVNFIDANGKITGILTAGTEPARYPLANHQPRLVSARAARKSVIACIDSTLLDVMVTLDQSAESRTIHVSPATGSDAGKEEDWMTRILQSEAFIKLAPTEIQRLFQSLRSLSVAAGDTIIRQGEEGDYFYIIRDGRCTVTRQVSHDGWEVPLAELGPGDSFGEEALVSDAPRNATITMLSDGTLMRLAKQDFLELLKKPLVHYVDYEQATAMVRNGDLWMDVRLVDEYSNHALDNSINIPLAEIRDRVSELATGNRYIICCNTGRRSAAAAFLLSQRGFEVHVLDGGLQKSAPQCLPGAAVADPASREETPDSWSIEPVDGGTQPLQLETRQPPASDAGRLETELEMLRRERDKLRARIRELELQLARPEPAFKSG